MTLNAHNTYSLFYSRALIALVVMLFCALPKVKAQETNYKAYSLYVYNFMKYVEWPEHNPQHDFVIVIFGKSPIEKELQNLANQKKIKGHNIVVKTAASMDDIGGCQLIYVAPEKSFLMKELNTKYIGKGVLIVGEKDGLANRGAALSFATLDNDELSFDINKRIIEQQNLKISGTLLQLGTVVVK